ncbi:hypothetical protein DFQ28_009596 [Apophysomyces sp. BC1034]|nr:hypothetical protein DFQ28_009596 [Apophysomyces sp. BC1034]
MIRVWDLQSIIKGAPGHTSRRGMIDISSYLSGRHDWFQGVGEIAVTGHLVACAPDATGPILVFSLLTGSLVYELKTTDSASLNEDVTAFTKLCMTPFFLLTKGKVKPSPDEPAPPAVLTQLGSREGLTPYQLYRSYQTNGMVHTRACVNVWDLQTGKLAYRLVPVLEKPASYTITDIRLSPDYSKVFACLEIQGRECKEQLYCWDFSESSKGVGDKKQLRIVQIDDVSPRRSTGKSWACFM